MEYERKGITIDWQIENVQNIVESLHVSSPVIPVDALDGTKFILGINGNRPLFYYLTIEKEMEDDNGPQSLLLSFEFSIWKVPSNSFSTENKIYHNEVGNKAACVGGNAIAWEGGNKLAVAGPILRSLLGYVKPTPDTLIIRCKIWKHHGSLSKNCHIFVRSRMRSESCKFERRLRNFSKLSANTRKPLKVVMSPENEKLMQANFVLFKCPIFSTGLCFVEFILKGNQTLLCFNFRLSIVDSSGNKKHAETHRSPGFTLNSKEPYLLRLHGFTKELFVNNASLYTPGDVLTVLGEIVYCAGKDYEKVETVEYEADIEAAKENPENASNDLNDLISKEGISDMNLQTETKTFQVHTAVLSAKSATFEAIFKSDTKETIEKCVHIESVDADTVKRMLVFLYSNTLEEMDWKDAMKLYIAAVKYQIAALKSRCVEFLKQEMDLSNCIVLLRLADMQSDNELKDFVQEYITRNVHHVIKCDQWREFEKNHPHLANYFSSNV